MNKEQIKKVIKEDLNNKDLDEIIALASAKRAWRLNSNWFSSWVHRNVNKNNSSHS